LAQNLLFAAKNIYFSSPINNQSKLLYVLKYFRKSMPRIFYSFFRKSFAFYRNKSSKESLNPIIDALSGCRRVKFIDKQIDFRKSAGFITAKIIS